MKLARPDYYQGILQLRDINDEVMNFVIGLIKKREDVAITKRIKFDNGVDLYLTSQKYVRIIGKKLKESFGGELKVTAKLHTRNRQGRELYRVTAFFRLLKYKAGDIVTVRGDKVRLISIRRKIFAKDIRTGRKMTIRSGDLKY